jgi:hypothetical protein
VGFLGVGFWGAAPAIPGANASAKAEAPAIVSPLASKPRINVRRLIRPDRYARVSSSSGMVPFFLP